ncbi:MAG: GNAT family N-acetyltransferase, partial [Rudanella sp.]|nr:GNAT family N-acetyltransferase [Rudanella sp.]
MIQHEYITGADLNPNVEEEILAFLNANQGFHYFQSPQFYKTCHHSKMLTPYYLLAKAEGKLVGVLLFFTQVQSMFPLISFLSSRNIIWGGPVVNGTNRDVVEGLLQHYESWKPVTIYTQIRNLVDMHGYKDLFNRFGFQYEEHLTILVDLSHSEDDLWKDVYTKRRNQIRRAVKEGCSVELQNTTAALHASYAILEEVYKRAKLPLPAFNHFESLLRFSDANSGLRIFKVIWEGRLIGCMLCLAYGLQLFDYYAGAYSDYYKKYPNDLLPWEVFKWAKANGFTCFDFGGAGKPDVPYGVREYKKQFGGQLVG